MIIKLISKTPFSCDRKIWFWNIIVQLSKAKKALSRTA